MKVKKEPLIRKGWLRALLSIFPFFIGMLVFQLIGVLVIGLIRGESSLFELKSMNELLTTPSIYEYLIMLFFGFSGTLFVVFVFRKFVDRKSFFSLGFDAKGRYVDILWGLGIVSIIYALTTFIFWLFGYMHGEFIKPVRWLKMGAGFLLFVIVSLNEEIYVRGYILQNLMDSLHRFVALVVSAAFFGILHILNPNVTLMGIVNVFFAGLFLGASYIYTKNLWFPISIHLFWNFVQGPVLGYNVSGQNFEVLLKQRAMPENIFTGGKFGFEGSILCSILLIISTGAIIVYYQRKTRKHSSTAKQYRR